MKDFKNFVTEQQEISINPFEDYSTSLIGNTLQELANQ